MSFYAQYPASSGGSANASVGLNGSTAPTSSTEIAGKNPSGNLQPVSVDSSGNVNVNVLSSTGTSAVNLTEVGGAAIALGQALAAASLPVVLTAAQLSTLTPLSSVTVTQATGTNLHTVVDSGSISVSNFPSTQPISGTVTANQGTANATPWNENISQVGGSAFALGQQLAAASLPVVLTAAQLSTLTPLTSVTVTQATAANLNATVTGSVSVSNFPSTQPVSGTVAATQSGTWNITNISGTVSLPTGAATAANQATEISSLSTIVTNTTGVATAANQTTANASLATIATNTGRSPINTTGSGSSAGATVSTVTTLTAPTNAVGFVLMNLDISTTNMRWAIGRTASSTLGQQLQPGRDTGFFPCGANISIIAESGTCNYDIQWVTP